MSGALFHTLFYDTAGTSYHGTTNTQLLVHTNTGEASGVLSSLQSSTKSLLTNISRVPRILLKLLQKMSSEALQVPFSLSCNPPEFSRMTISLPLCLQPLKESERYGPYLCPTRTNFTRSNLKPRPKYTIPSLQA